MEGTMILNQLEDSISRKIIKLRNKIRNKLNIEFANAGLNITSEMYSVMRCLWEQEGINQQSISEKAFKEKANLTKLLDNLEKRGFLYKETDAFDKRNKKVFLTPQGREIKTVVLEITQEYLLDVEKNIDQEALLTAKKVLDKLIAAYP